MFFRKQKRTDSELSDSSTSSRPSSVNSKGLFSLAKSRSKTSIESEYEKSHGKLGLSLLHSPDNPSFDFVFVHGLGGDSRKTWSKSGLNFWPHEWLPKDPAFSLVRIHTYGYRSDYLKGKGDCLNIHHFGKALLAAISTSPYLANSNTNIVAIGHSLGGLVIKKAYMLAKHDAIHSSLADRLSAIYFLATPHRGADSAKLLKNILRIAYDRPYVGDLNPSSSALQSINDEFRHVSANLELWSFYETQNLKMFGSRIVEPESALLGYREEKQVPMAADHRSICKFDTESDPSYILLRNALASTVSGISRKADVETRNRDMKRLGKYLEVTDILDEDYSHLCESRHSLSCEWILEKEEFVEWKKESKLLWIKGQPASGKSVLASFIIEHLHQHDQKCSFFFFKHGDTTKSTLHRCLRHWAYQMADADEDCRQELLQKAEDGIQLTHMDERTIWRILFQSGMIRKLQRVQYFVIDALDECSNSSVFFDAILPSLDPQTPLKILFLSRITPYIHQGLSSLSIKAVCSMEITEEDTLPDLRRIIESKIRLLPAVQISSQDLLIGSILAKSKGSFLWTKLVLQELLSCHTLNEVNQVLDDVPKGMEPWYKRTICFMEAAPRSKILAKAILVWTVCAIRPMSISELNGALKLDMSDTFPQLRESIVALCGQLVTVEKSGKVQMIHETAREFILSKKLVSEFAVNAEEAHTHMAKICLQYLIGDEMRPPRTIRRRNPTGTDARDDFASYACYAYSYHLSKAEPSSLELFDLVESFLKSNILTWIEVIARNKDFKQLIRSSNHLRIYANACATEHSTVNKRVQTLQKWPKDLARTTAVFSTALATAPSAIHTIIPPLCPRSSQLNQTAGASRRLKILGSVNETWDDRLLGIDFRRGQPTSICYGEEFLAIGLMTGTVSLYYLASYQEYRVFNHGESVTFVAFKKKTSFLATCGFKSVKVWNLRTGTVLHSFKSPPRPLDLQFQGNSLLVPSSRNFIASWDVTKEDEIRCIETTWVDSDNGSSGFGTAGALALSEEQKMLAVAYNGRPITIWDTEEAFMIGTCGKKLPTGDTSTHPVTSMVFNPNPGIVLLAATYLDGNLALLDPLEDRQVECFRAHCQSLAASPNGRLLAAGGADGVVYVFEFDTLKLLYEVKSHNSFIKKLCFAKDSFIFADIRGTRCTVWEPEAMLRDSLGDDSSGITSNSAVEITSIEPKANITAISVPGNCKIIFCGKDDGTVESYNASTAECLGTLYKHNVGIRHIKSWADEKEIFVLSVDIANRVLLHKSSACDIAELTAFVTVLEIYLEAAGAITHLLINGSMRRILLSTAGSDFLVDLNTESDRHERILDTRPSTSPDRQWIDHPTSVAQLLCISDLTAGIYLWDSLEKIGEMPFETSDMMQDFTTLNKTLAYVVGGAHKLLLELFDPITGATCISTSEAMDHTSFASNSGQLSPPPNDTLTSAPNILHDGKQVLKFYKIITERLDILHTLGVNQSDLLVFLNRDSWVCSIDLRAPVDTQMHHSKATSKIRAMKHFFLPNSWLAGRKSVIASVTRKDILLARGNELIIIRDYMSYES